MAFQIEDSPVFTEPVRLPSPSAEAPVANILERVGQQMDQVGTGMYRARQAGVILRAKTEAYVGLRAAEIQAQDAPDAKKAMEVYGEAADKVKANIAKYGFDEYTNARIELAFQHQNALTGLSVNRDAHAKMINQAQANLMADYQQHVQGAGNDANPDKSDWQESWRHTLEVARAGGIISPTKQEEWQTTFNRESDHSAALSLGYAAPGAGYAALDAKTPDGNFANWKSLNPTDRAQLKEQMVNHSIALMRFQESQETRMEREANKALITQQDTLMGQFYATATEHSDPELEKHILAARNDLGPKNFDKLMTSLKGGAFGDDKDTVLNLNKSLFDPTVSGVATRGQVFDAYRNGKITEATFSTLNRQTEEYEARGGKPKILAPVDIAEKWLQTVTGADAAHAGLIRGPGLIRIANAQASFEDWKRAHPGADYATARKYAEGLAQEWVHSAHLDSAAVIPRLQGINWTKDEKGNPDFQAMSAANARLKTTNLKQYTQNLEALGAQSRAWEKKQADQAAIEAASGTRK